jgi:methionyl-tRNA formyltransferase
MRLTFLGTPEAAVPSLDALVAAGHDVVLVVTRPDKRRGRGSELSPSPVKTAARAHGLRVTHRLADVETSGAERGVVVAYGAMIPASLLAVVPMLNVHFSLLPRWRGAAPVQRAILAGDLDTGVSIISLEAALDTGPVHLERHVAIEEKSAAVLIDELARLGAAALIEVLGTPALLAHPRAQTGEVTYAEKITKETLHLSPSRSAEETLRTVRLGGAFCFVEGLRVMVLGARASVAVVAAGVVTSLDGEVVLGTAEGTVALDSVRPEGSQTMAASAWWRGRYGAGTRIQWS